MEDNHLIGELMAEANRQANEVSDLLNRAAAALAQNAQGAAAWMAIHPGIGDVALFTEFPQNYADAGVKVTPLYLHAERTRVPAGYVLVPREPTDEMVSAGASEWRNQNMFRLWGAFLAAAPAQPEDAA